MNVISLSNNSKIHKIKVKALGTLQDAWTTNTTN